MHACLKHQEQSDHTSLRPKLMTGDRPVSPLLSVSEDLPRAQTWTSLRRYMTSAIKYWPSNGECSAYCSILFQFVSGRKRSRIMSASTCSLGPYMLPLIMTRGFPNADRM